MPSAERAPACHRVDERGSGAELVELVERLRPRLRRAFYRFSVSLEDSEDIVQSGLLAALTRWREIVEPEAWLMGTICTMCRTRRRGKFWRNVLRMDAVQVERLAPMSPAPQLRRQMLADIEGLMRRLSVSERAVLYLRFQLGMGPLEVAQVIGQDPVWVRQLVHRVLRRLRKQIAADRRRDAARPGVAVLPGDERPFGRADRVGELPAGSSRG